MKPLRLIQDLPRGLCSLARALPWAAKASALSILLLALGFLLTPIPESLRTPAPQSAEFLDVHDTPLRLILRDERQYARSCSLSEVSPHLIAATLSAEDHRFYSHHGVDPRSTASALAQWIRLGRPHSGASTITQQLVKIADPAPRTLPRKLREAWLALRIESAWTKPQILEAYLNRLDYGNLQFGIAQASRFYFGKPPSDLSPAESALLAALPKAPSRLNPHTALAAAKQRQQWILGRMLSIGHLDSPAFTRAKSEPLRIQPRPVDFAAPHFVELLLHRQGTLPRSGGTVRTTLDLPLNTFAEHLLAENLSHLTDQQAAAAAVVVLHVPSGEVRALAASGNFFDPRSDSINGAWSVRSPGSALKPFTYLLALERGAHTGTVVADVPTSFPTPTGVYTPNNYNRRFHGPVSLRTALGNSLNVAAIRTLQIAGGPEALQRTLLQCGITTLHQPADYYGLGLTLGNGEVRLLELTNAYATIARMGSHLPFRLLASATPSFTPRQVFSPEAAYLTADILADNAARAAAFGLDSHLHFDFPVACKTGTSSDYRDNWALGFTPEFCVGVWVGNPNGKPMREITGVTGAGPILHQLFNHLHERFGTSWFSSPPRVLTFAVDPLTGRQPLATVLTTVPSPASGAPVRPQAMEKGIALPEPARPADYDASGRVRLSAEYSPWIRSNQNPLGPLLCEASSETLPTPLRLTRPAPGTLYYLDPDLPNESQWIPIDSPDAAGNPGQLQWDCPTATLEPTPLGARCRLQPGTHTINVRDPATGRSCATWIRVQPL